MATTGGESLGTARIDLSIDTTEMEVGVRRAQDYLREMGTSAEGVYAGLNRSELARINTLRRQIDTLGMTREQQLAYNITLRTSGQLQEDLLGKLNHVTSTQRANAEVTRMMSDSFAAMQTKARNAFRELQSAAREEQMLRDAHAAKALADAAELAGIKAKHAAQGVEFLAMRADAERVNRMRQAVSVFGGSLDQLDTKENRATMGGRQFIRMVRDQEAALTRTNGGLRRGSIEFNQYGLSVKQTEAALRQVPAQLTDIFVSLQGGQNPLTVLLQQGGQLRDVFGGAMPAIRAMVAQLGRLINPWTAAAGVAGTFTFAMLQGEQRMNAFNRQLILTGQQGALTARDLQEMANVMDEMAHVTSRQAAAALTEVAGSGLIAADNFELVARAAVAMQDTTGKAVADTVSEYADLARDPVNALLKLNETEHFLTASILERVRELQEAGRIEEAAALATETRAQAQMDAANEIVESLGLVSGAWYNVKGATAEAWDEAVNYFANLDREAKEATRTLGQMWESLRSSVSGAGPWALMQALQTPPAAAAGGTGGAGGGRTVDSRAERELHAIVMGNLDREERQRREILRIRNLGVAAGWDEAKIAKAIADSEARFAESGKKGGQRGIDKATTREGLQAFKDDLAERQAALKADTAILRAEFDAKLVTQQEYFAGTRDLMVQERQAQEEALLGQIAFLRGRNVTGKEAIDVQRELGKLEAELTKVRLEATGALRVLDIQESAFLEARKNALLDYEESLDLGTAALRDQVQSQIDSILMSQRQFDTQQRVNQVLREAAEAERELARARRDGELTPADYEQKLAAVQRAAAERVAIEEGAYAAIDIAQQDWRAGMRAGLQDWVNQASDVASQVRRITVGALDRIADGFAELALTGKFHWRQLLADILSELVKFFAKQAVLQFVKYFAGAWLGQIGSGFQAPAAGSGAESAAYDNWYNANGGTGQSMSMGGGQMQAIGMPTAMAAGGGPMTLNVTTNISANGTTQTSVGGDQDRNMRAAADQIRSVTESTVRRMMQPGGALWKAGVTVS